jgi:hypothetical protein
MVSNRICALLGALTVLAVLAQAGKPVVSRHVGSSLHPNPAIWEHVGRASDDVNLRLTGACLERRCCETAAAAAHDRDDDDDRAVALRNRNVDKLKETVRAVSKPRSPRYGQYLSLEEISGLTAPSPADAHAVARFFTTEMHAASAEITRSGDFIAVVISARAVEHYFAHQGARVAAFRHRHSGRLVHRAVSPAALRLPAHIEKHIDILVGLQEFAVYPTDRRRTMAAAARSTGTSAPDFVIVKAGPTDFAANVIIYCTDGERTKNATAPCADRPPKLSILEFVVTPHAGGEFGPYFYPFDLTCTADPASGNVTCLTPPIEVSCAASLLSDARTRPVTSARAPRAADAALHALQHQRARGLRRQQQERVVPVRLAHLALVVRHADHDQGVLRCSAKHARHQRDQLSGAHHHTTPTPP